MHIYIFSASARQHSLTDTDKQITNRDTVEIEIDIEVGTVGTVDIETAKLIEIDEIEIDESGVVI